MFVDLVLAKESLSLDAKTGHLFWKRRPDGHFSSIKEARRWNGRYAGTRAGSLAANQRGYTVRRVKLGPTNYLEHHLVWAMYHDCQPPEVIDHINRDATDNRPRNLRNGAGINHLNVSRYRNNRSGVAGVHWDSCSGKWKAQGSVAGKRIHIGLFADLASAEQAVIRFRAVHGYKQGHGSARTA